MVLAIRSHDLFTSAGHLRPLHLHQRPLHVRERGLGLGSVLEPPIGPRCALLPALRPMSTAPVLPPRAAATTFAANSRMGRRRCVHAPAANLADSADMTLTPSSDAPLRPHPHVRRPSDVHPWDLEVGVPGNGASRLGGDHLGYPAGLLPRVQGLWTSLLDHISRIPQPCTAPQAPCGELFVAAMRLEC